MIDATQSFFELRLEDPRARYGCPDGNQGYRGPQRPSESIYTLMRQIPYSTSFLFSQHYIRCLRLFFCSRPKLVAVRLLAGQQNCVYRGKSRHTVFSGSCYAKLISR